MRADGFKRCGVCGEYKGPTAFHIDRSRGDGLTYRCRACTSAYHRGQRVIRRPPSGQSLIGRFAPVVARDGWCDNCVNHRHGPDCTAAYFGPGCSCGCGVLGYRNPYGERDPFAPAPMDREIA